MSVKGTWNINLGRIRSKISEGVKQKVVRVSTQLYNDIVAGTPVDTGQLRASWNMSSGFPDYSTVDQGGATGAPLAPPAPPKIGSLPDFPTIFICNGKVYASIIEYGTSKTAPAAMVRLAITRLR